jgi:hypothetical protein
VNFFSQARVIGSKQASKRLLLDKQAIAFSHETKGLCIVQSASYGAATLGNSFPKV